MGVPRGAVNSAWFFSCLSSWVAYRRDLARSESVQRGLLLDCLRRNADTAYGRRYGFRSISGVRDYQERVPPVNYDDIQGFVRRVAGGEPGVLTGERVTHFEPTSGSTAAVKLIPCTQRLRKEFLRGISPWIFDLFLHRPHLLWGPGYWSLSPPLQMARRTAAGIPIGYDDDSAYLGGWGRWVASALAVPPGVSRISDPDTFRYATLLFLLGAGDLRLVSVWNPTFLSLLLKPLPALWDALLEDLARGTFSFPGAGDPVPREALEGHRPRPARARDLRRLGPENWGAIWPDLRLVSCWASAHAKEPAEALARSFPAVEIQGKGLIATEAFVTLPFEGLDLLAVRSHFFEFEDGKGNFLLAHQLEQGGRYSVLVTTGGGLYRYRLQDEVEVTGYCGTTPALRFLGKEGMVSDLRGEKISEGFAGDVIARLRALIREPLPFALLAPDISSDPPRYTLYLESESPLAPEVSSHLERALRENPHYAHCVKLGQLSPSRVFLVRRGVQERFFREQVRMGFNLGGLKPSPFSRHGHWSQVLGGVYLEDEAAASPPDSPDATPPS